ncbi:hypothetical protein LCGC14_1152690 [marine sediment metagenome]|uniref:Uncharacterized protein n=1 Tax=marine sediment metagenome TaxID=412755 RepID=A0A0F9MI91_9ZZZZ
MAMARIVVSFGASEQWSLGGEEEVIREQYRTIKDILDTTVDGVGTKFFEFIGCQERVDRKPEQFMVRVEDIKAVSFQEM